MAQVAAQIVHLTQAIIAAASDAALLRALEASAQAEAARAFGPGQDAYAVAAVSSVS